MFPQSGGGSYPSTIYPGAGEYTYQQAIQAYGSRYLFHEPRKTFRLTISTTF